MQRDRPLTRVPGCKESGEASCDYCDDEDAPHLEADINDFGAVRLGRFGTNDGTDNLPRNAGFPETFSSDKTPADRAELGDLSGP